MLIFGASKFWTNVKFGHSPAVWHIFARHCSQPFEKRLGKETANLIDMQLPQNFHKALGLNRKKGPVTALHVFDFDGTLVRTPSPAEGKPKYFLKTGEPWKGGWWGNMKSLSPPVIDSPFPETDVIQSVFDEMEEVVSRSETAIGIVVTGRIKPLRPAVLRILDEVCIARENDTVPHGKSFLHHDAVFTHPGGRLDTLEYKIELLKCVLTSEPVANLRITDLHIWEDRIEHAEVFANRLSKDVHVLTGAKTTVHLIRESIP